MIVNTDFIYLSKSSTLSYYCSANVTLSLSQVGFCMAAALLTYLFLLALQPPAQISLGQHLPSSSSSSFPKRCS